MRHVADTLLSVDEVIAALDAMPKERQPDFVAGKLTAQSIARSYTRIDGCQFHVSRTAGYGSDVTCSGVVVDHQGQTRVFLQTRFGLFPHWVAYLAALLCLGLAAVMLRDSEVFYAGVAFAGAVAFVSMVALHFSEARFLRREISKALGDVDWRPADEQVV